MQFNSLPNDKVLDWSKLKNIAEEKINLDRKSTLVLERVENIVGKGENAGHQHFLFFLQCFPKHFRVVKSRDCVVKT